MSVNSKDKIRILHILDAIIEIENYLEKISIDSFSENLMMVNATIRQLEIIGEASNHLTEEIKDQYKSVEWKQIIGLRNILIHEYFNVDIPLVWSVIQYDLPHFKQTIITILEDLNKNNESRN